MNVILFALFVIALLAIAFDARNQRHLGTTTAFGFDPLQWFAGPLVTLITIGTTGNALRSDTQLVGTVFVLAVPVLYLIGRRRCPSVGEMAERRRRAAERAARVQELAYDKAYWENIAANRFNARRGTPEQLASRRRELTPHQNLTSHQNLISHQKATNGDASIPLAVGDEPVPRAPRR